MIRIYYISKLILRGLRMRPWGSLLTFFACWFALCQLSLVLYTVEVADRASMMPANSGSMIVYLKNGTSGTRISDIEKSIRGYPEIAALKFVPKQAGLEKMKEWLGPDKSLVEGVDASILPDAFEITLKREYGDKAESIAGRIGGIQGVDNVRYHKGLMGYIAGSYRTIALAGGLVAGLVVICLSLVIFLSVRVGIVSRRQEIEVLNLLGGQFLFIYSPYLIEAGTYGLLGALAALFTSSTLVNYFHMNFPALRSIVPNVGMTQAAEVLFFALVCSISGALLAIKRSIDA